MLYTLETAMASRDMEAWVHGYLTTVGNNKAFSEGLKIEKRYYQGPVLMKLQALKRSCGPEGGLKYYEPKDNFDKRVNKMIESLEKGWEMPPLIVKYNKDGYELSDGNHRHEALLQHGVEEYWVILWDSQGCLVEEIVSKHYGEFEIIEKYKNGQIKDVYHFSSQGHHYTISLSAALEHWETRVVDIEGVPLKKRLHSGEYKGQSYQIHTMVEGDHKTTMSPKYLANILGVLTKIHNHKINPDGYGFINDQRHESLEAFVNHFFSSAQGGYWKDWEKLFEDTILEKEVFNHYLTLLSSVLHYCDGKQYLVHGDYHLTNLLSSHEEITCVLDWDNCMYLDYVYDIVCLQGFTNKDDHVYKDYYTAHGFDTDNFEERILCMKLFIGLDSLRFFAKNNHNDLYEQRKETMHAFVDLYMNGPNKEA